MSSSSLNHKVPLSFCFKIILSFTLLLEFLVVYVLFMTCLQGYKLSARSFKCVFLGYSPLQKEYRCYSLETKKYYMSANVTFFEQTPYFSPSVQDVHLIQQVLSIPVVEYNIPNVSINPSLDQSPPEPSSPHIDSLQHRTPTNSPVFQEHGESPTSDSSPSSLDTTTPGEGDSGWPIALRKGTCSSRNPHPIYNFLCYHRLSPSYCSLLSSVSFTNIPLLGNVST